MERFKPQNPLQKKIKADGNIYTYNSLNASLGQGQIAVYAAKCAKNGKDIHSTLEELNTIRKNTKKFVSYINEKIKQKK